MISWKYFFWAAVRTISLRLKFPVTVHRTLSSARRWYVAFPNPPPWHPPGRVAQEIRLLILNLGRFGGKGRLAWSVVDTLLARCPRWLFRWWRWWWWRCWWWRFWRCFRWCCGPISLPPTSSRAWEDPVVGARPSPPNKNHYKYHLGYFESYPYGIFARCVGQCIEKTHCLPVLKSLDISIDQY